MDEMLTFEEIKARFAPDWVLIADPQTDERQNVLGGRVVFHGPNHDEMYDKAIEMKLDRIAVAFLGERSKDMVFAL